MGSNTISLGITLIATMSIFLVSFITYQWIPNNFFAATVGIGVGAITMIALDEQVGVFSEVNDD